MKFQKKFNTDEQTSRRMSHVVSKGGKDENIVAHSLWKKGIRYRRNYSDLPGKPDIAITKFKIAVFIDGEFWHGYNWEKQKKSLKRNKNYWIKKIEYNMQRDKKNDRLLINMGWIPIHFWSKTALKHTNYCVEYIMLYIRTRKLEYLNGSSKDNSY